MTSDQDVMPQCRNVALRLVRNCFPACSTRNIGRDMNACASNMFNVGLVYGTGLEIKDTYRIRTVEGMLLKGDVEVLNVNSHFCGCFGRSRV